MAELTVKQIVMAIKKAGLDWVAEKTPLSELSMAEQDERLGLKVEEAEVERISKALAAVKAEEFPITYPSRIDWRVKDGENWVEPIRDQGACGSCVAFGTVATIEAQARIQKEKPDWQINLSEADLFFCGGAKCAEGWWPTYALDYAKQKGVTDESCFPYEARDLTCKPCGDRANRFIIVGTWSEIININQRKEWLSSKGPLIGCMAVYRDFFSYRDGVYKPTTPDLAGYHCIACIGYSEEEKCWICKNSWGDDWGDKGYFKIAYGVAEIDTRFAKYGVQELSGPLMKEEEEEEGEWADHLVVDYSFNTNQRVLWAYVGGAWRSKAVSDSQLAALGDVIFGSTRVQAYYEGDQLTRIRGWKKFS
jgi:C1A family cysteine protease